MDFPYWKFPTHEPPPERANLDPLSATASKHGEAMLLVIQFGLNQFIDLMNRYSQMPKHSRRSQLSPPYETADRTNAATESKRCLLNGITAALYRIWHFQVISCYRKGLRLGNRAYEPQEHVGFGIEVWRDHIAAYPAATPET